MSTSYFLPDSPSTTNPFDSISSALRASQVSYQARIFLGHIAMWAGSKGVCWWSIRRMAEFFDTTDRTIQRWQSELVRAGLLEVHQRYGRSNLLVPFPEKATEHSDSAVKGQGVTCMVSPIKESSKTKTFSVAEGPVDNSAPGTNVIKIPHSFEPEEPVTASPLTAPQAVVEPADPVETASQRPVPPAKPDRTRTRGFDFLVEQIESTTQDFHSTGAFINAVRNNSEQTIFQALSAVRCGESIRNPGAYFLATVRALTRHKVQTGSSTPSNEHKPSEAPWIGLDGLRLMHPHLKVESLWNRYRELRPEADLDSYRRFLQFHGREVWEQKPHYRRL